MNSELMTEFKNMVKDHFSRDEKNLKEGFTHAMVWNSYPSYTVISKALLPLSHTLVCLGS